MLRKESLTEIMIKEHGEIYNSLTKFRLDSERDIRTAFKFFNFFKKQELEHIKIENKIFATKWASAKITRILIEQHNKIKKFMAGVYNDVYNRKDSTQKVEVLQKFLRAHLRLEERKFYPKLDKRLGYIEVERLRKEISKRMSKIRKKFFK